MASTASLRKEAENKRLLAQALDEEERAANLRAAAEAADKAALGYRAKAKAGGGILEQIGAVIFTLAFWGGLALWLMGG